MRLFESERSAIPVISLGIEEDLLHQLERSLPTRKYVLQPAASPSEIEAALEDPQLKLILLDLDRSGWSCLALLEANPEGHPRSPVIAVTRADSLPEHRAARYFKVREFLVRPFGATELEMALDRCLEHYRLKTDNARLRQTADHYRLELARHLLRYPLGMDLTPPGEAAATVLSEEAFEQSRREKHWKELLHAQDNLDRLLQEIVVLVTQEWKAERASLMLFDRLGEELVIRQAVGLDEKVIERTRVRVGQGPSGYVAETRRPLLVQDPLDFLVSNWPQRHEHTSFVSIPLLCAGELIGVLNVTGKQKGGQFSEEEMHSLVALGGIAADALDRLILYEGLQEGYLGTIKALALAIERKDPWTCGHSARVSEISLAIADELQLNPEERETLESAATLHDIGKIAIPAEIVHKPGPLTLEENDVLRQHPFVGSQLLGCLRHFEKERDVIRHHHEWYNGGGYPDHLRGEQLSLSARVVAVADAYDAMISPRAYRPALDPECAYREIKAQSGSQFDPEVVRIFSQIWNSRAGQLFTSPAPPQAAALVE